MKMCTKIFKTFSFLLCWFAFISGCGASPDLGEAPGTCPIDCSSAIIASQEMSIIPFTSKIEVNCQGITPNTDYSNIIPIRFAISKQQTADEQTSGTVNLLQEEGAEDQKPQQPVSGISFEVLTVGGELSQTPNPEDERSQYYGILTPKSNWCTDACGVGAVDIVPLCKAKENNVKVLIHSGSLYKTIDVVVSP